MNPIYIAHRGSYKGANPERENTLPYILEAIDQGFDCEIDVWLDQKRLKLGHDEPKEIIDIEILTMYADKLWVHVKNIECFQYLYDHFKNRLNFFHHSADDFALTSKGYFWHHSSFTEWTPRSVIVMPELVNLRPQDADKFNVAGICSDRVEKYRSKNPA